MKKFEKFIFLILVDNVLIFYDSLGKETKNSHSLEEKLQKESTPANVRLNDAKEAEALDSLFYNQNSINLRKLECDFHLNYCCDCTDSTHCLKCYNKYFLNEGQCKECSHFCKSCNDLTKCTKCYTGYYLSKGECIKCPNDCSSCSSSTTCIECDYGYYENDGKCIKCSEGCNNCDNSTECSRCDLGYYLNLTIKKCERCSTGCTLCVDSMYCFSCNKDLGYILNPLYECVKCPITKPYIYYNDSTQECVSTCPERYGPIFYYSPYSECIDCPYKSYNEDGKCQRCPETCLSCSNFINCTNCDYYLLENGECIPVTSKGCLSEIYYNFETGKCERCLKGYELSSDGKCEKKTIPDTKFILYEFKEYSSYGETFSFEVEGLLIQGLMYEAQMQFDYKIKRHDNQNVDTGSGLCIQTEFAKGDANIEDNYDSSCNADDDYYENDNDYFFSLQCEGTYKPGIYPNDEINITNIKLTKLNKEEVNNENIQSTRLLNYPLNKKMQFYYSDIAYYLYYLKWYRFVANTNKCTILQDNDKSKNVIVYFSGTIIDDEKISNLNFTIPLYKLSSDDSLNKNASCTLNKEINKNEATMECTIKGLDSDTFTLDKIPVEASDSNYFDIYLSTYIENEAIECKKENDLSASAIAGIVLGSLVVAGILVGGLVSGIANSAAGGAGAAAGGAAAGGVGGGNPGITNVLTLPVKGETMMTSTRLFA